MQPLQPARSGGRRAGQGARFEQQVRSDLLQRRWLRVHVCCIAMLTLAVCWGLSALLMHAGVQALALRHALALLGAYAAYLGLMHLWARWMLARDNHLHPADAVDAVGGIADLTTAKARPSCASGLPEAGGGDFAGAGANGHWEGAADGVSSARRVAGGLADAADLDETAVVVVPVAVVVGAALLLATALGFAVFGLFGIDILLGVAVEIAFASAGGALALQARREGWLMHVVRRTAGPMAVVLLATVAAGLLIGHWLPEARSLPHAWQLITGR